LSCVVGVNWPLFTYQLATCVCGLFRTSVVGLRVCTYVNVVGLWELKFPLLVKLGALKMTDMKLTDMKLTNMKM